MMIDGVWQAMSVAAVLSSIADRDWRDQALFVAHILIGAGLVFTGRVLLAGEARTAAPASVLIAALLLSFVETTWFNWTDVALRAVYTAVALVIVLRKTTLPTT